MSQVISTSALEKLCRDFVLDKEKAKLFSCPISYHTLMAINLLDISSDRGVSKKQLNRFKEEYEQHAEEYALKKYCYYYVNDSRIICFIPFIATDHFAAAVEARPSSEVVPAIKDQLLFKAYDALESQTDEDSKIYGILVETVNVWEDKLSKSSNIYFIDRINSIRSRIAPTEIIFTTLPPSSTPTSRLKLPPISNKQLRHY